MPLLSLDQVVKRYPSGGRERLALCRVSLVVEPGELVAILGRRRSGRTTLMQVAAGLEPPSEGTVCFDDVDLRRRPMLGVQGGIASCITSFPAALGDTVLDQVAMPPLGDGASLVAAQGRAHELLRRVDAAACAQVNPAELDPAETIRVALARALIGEPRLLLVDEPVLGVRPSECDDLIELVRSIAHDDGVAVVMTVDSANELAGSDRALSLDAGELRGELVPTPAPVVPLRRRADRSA